MTTGDRGRAGAAALGRRHARADPGRGPRPVLGALVRGGQHPADRRAGGGPAAAARLPLRQQGGAVADGRGTALRAAGAVARRSGWPACGGWRTRRWPGWWWPSSSASRRPIPQLHRIIMQECKSEGERLDLAGRAARPPPVRGGARHARTPGGDGRVRDLPPAHLYYLLTGAGGHHLRAGARVPAADRRRPGRPGRGRAARRAVLSMVFVA